MANEMPPKVKVGAWLIDHPRITGLILAALAGYGAYNAFEIGRTTATGRALMAEIRSQELGG